MAQAKRRITSSYLLRDFKRRDKHSLPWFGRNYLSKEYITRAVHSLRARNDLELLPPLGLAGTGLNSSQRRHRKHQTKVLLSYLLSGPDAYWIYEHWIVPFCFPGTYADRSFSFPARTVKPNIELFCRATPNSYLRRCNCISWAFR